MASMNLSTHLVAKIIDNKAISLSSPWTNRRIKVLGSTMATSVICTGNYNSQSHVNIYPEKAKCGIVAVVVIVDTEGDKGRIRSEYIPAFLKVVWKEKDGSQFPFVDLDDPWIPANRIGQVTSEAIEVMLSGGKRFCTEDHSVYGYNNGKNLPGYVPDGSLLCHYLWGSASAADVLHAAVQKKLEPLATKRVAELTSEAQRLQHANSVLAHNLREEIRASNSLEMAKSDLE